MAHVATDGKRFTNRPPMMAHNRSLARAGKGSMERTDPLAQPGHEDEGGMEPHHEAIHQHLQSMHDETGEAHSHIEHHADGSHTSHHITAGGEMHGPHDHANLDALKSHMDQFLDEEGHEGEGDGGEEAEYE